MSFAILATARGEWSLQAASPNVISGKARPSVMSSKNVDLVVNMHTSSLTRSPFSIRIQESSPKVPEAVPKRAPRHPKAPQMVSKGASECAPRHNKELESAAEVQSAVPKAPQGTPKLHSSPSGLSKIISRPLYSQTSDQPPRRPARNEHAALSHTRWVILVAFFV